MNWAQIIMVAIITFNVVTDIMHDGEERVRKFDATKPCWQQSFKYHCLTGVASLIAGSNKVVIVAMLHI